MKYTENNLHGVVYYHHTDSPTKTRRIIKADIPSHGKTYTDCKMADGITHKPWFTLQQAQDWIDRGIWRIVNPSEKINNTYEIY